MVLNHLTLETSLEGLDKNDWFSQIDDICDEHGFFEHLGPAHFAGFLEAGNKLFVTFENVDQIIAHNKDAEPRGFAFARNDGWSHLALFSVSNSWFRDREVYDLFDRLSDDGFFDGFEHILFHGTGAAGYAAAAFSVAAPGATVLAVRPQATLDPAITGWDKRFFDQRRQSFSTRYGYAPDMIEAASDVFIAYDPLQSLDAMHAVLFRNPNVTLLPCRFMGGQLEQAFERMEIHDVMISLAMDHKLDRCRFNHLLRARKYDEGYASAVVTSLLQQGHRKLAKLVCSYMLLRGKQAFFEDTLRRLNEQPSLEL
ncbi:phosphoadenosine phosphosulfate reductase [Yoonia sediminilitoris]|nr:phosphoadenosine phosphosulfate reductase [Yoonia sediminilitoris]